MSQCNDLEEGEIEDDPLPIIITKEKSKTPPRQYRLHKHHHNTNSRKKKFKHVPKLSPEGRVSKPKVTHRIRNHSCSRHRYSSIILDHILPKNRTFPTLAQRSVRLKTSPAKAISQPNPDISLNMAPHVSTNVTHNEDSQNLSLSATIEKMLDFYKKMHGNNPTKTLSHSQADKSFRGGGNDIIIPKGFSNFDNAIYKDIKDELRNSKFLILNPCEKKKKAESISSLNDVFPDSTSRPFEKSKSCLESDEEDEEELRRIALASCLRRSDVVSCPKNPNSPHIENSCLDELKENMSVNCLPAQNSDNYEVVDMDLDGDQSTNETECDENPNYANSSLFIIDKEPFREHAIPTQMKILKPKQVLDMKRNIEVLTSNNRDASKIFKNNEIKPFLTELKSIANDQDILQTCSENSTVKINPSLPNLDSKSSMTSDSNVVSPAANEIGLIISKINRENANSSCAPRERIIIKLTGESSSDESEEENEDKSETFANLEALISDARKMSNESSVAKSSATEAVSCLSKAQQQEYNKLKKIIAQKESSTAQQKIVHSSSDDLKLLEKNLLLTLSALQKEKRFLNATRLVVAKRRKNFLRSQLAFQYIKEKFLAAEKKKNADSQLYNKSLTQFQVFQNSVTKRQTLINDLERECKKLGTSVRGSNYKPPSITFPSIHRIRTPKRIPTGTTT